MVVGDPAGMRALADALAKDADQLGNAAHDAKKAWSRADASGPWAHDVGVLVDAHSSRFKDAATELKALVRLLRSSADDVERQIAAEQAREAAEQRQQAEAARQAKQ